MVKNKANKNKPTITFRNDSAEDKLQIAIYNSSKLYPIIKGEAEKYDTSPYPKMWVGETSNKNNFAIYLNPLAIPNMGSHRLSFHPTNSRPFCKTTIRVRKNDFLQKVKMKKKTIKNTIVPFNEKYASYDKEKQAIFFDTKGMLQNTENEKAQVPQTLVQNTGKISNYNLGMLQHNILSSNSENFRLVKKTIVVGFDQTQKILTDNQRQFYQNVLDKVKTMVETMLEQHDKTIMKELKDFWENE